MKTFVQIGAFLSFFFCLLGGLWILRRGNIGKDDILTTAIGFYFVGKAFFVGPTLLLAANKRRLKKERREWVRDVAAEGDLY